MVVYFSASLSYRKELSEDYKAIISTLKELGVKKVTSVDVLHAPIRKTQIEIDEGIKKWKSTWIKYIHECDFALSEISYPSTINIGFEIGDIISHGKPVLGLYKVGRKPFFTRNDNLPKKFIESSYTKENLKDVLSWGIGEIKEVINKRFTFLVPPEVSNFLDKAYEEHNISASDLIRNLIKKEMRRLGVKENQKSK
jgi:hypothetical protein